MRVLLNFVWCTNKYKHIFPYKLFMEHNFKTDGTFNYYQGILLKYFTNLGNGFKFQLKNIHEF